MQPGTRPLNGMRQLYPEEMAAEEHVVRAIRGAALAYGYQEYDGPTLEPAELFLAKSGSELALEQSYRFLDRGGRDVVLRPEMTPVLARMLASAPEVPQPVRWMSFPICFRYERPQRGRAREFRQFNCDLLGDTGLRGDLEIILVLDRIMRTLGAPPGSYRIGFSSRRLATMALERLGIPPEAAGAALGAVDRISKMPRDQWMEHAALAAGGAACAESLARFAGLQSLEDPWLSELLGDSEELASARELAALLSSAGLSSAVFDPSVVRGLDYYTGTVFELLDAGGGSRRAICGGGRYDNLVGMFGGRPLSGVGFGLGILTLKLFLEAHGLLPEDPGASSRPQVFVAVYSQGEYSTALRWAEALRDAGIRTELDPWSRTLNRQFASAVKRRIPFVLTVGPREAASGRPRLREMGAGVESDVTVEEAVAIIERSEGGLT